MQRFKNILCVIGTESNDSAALEYAVKLAENNQATLSVVEVVDEIPPNTKLLERVLAPEELQAKMVEEHLQRLDELVAPWRVSVDIQVHVLSGIPYLEVVKEVIRNDRDLVIKTAESGGLLDRVFGSDDMHLLRKCPCPVWLVKPNSPNTYKRILAAVDADDNYPVEELNTRSFLNHQILEMACSLSLPESAELHVVHTWNAIGEDAMRFGFIQTPEDKINTYVEEVRQHQGNNLDVLMSEIANKIGQDTLEYIKPQIHFVKGTPRKSVPELAKKIEADIVVMGTVSRTGVPGFFIGNTAECILNQLDCSVLAVKPPGFVTPITLDDKGR
jgi:nucleotide-binding universal stress UspA family protein